MITNSKTQAHTQRFIHNEEQFYDSENKFHASDDKF